MKKTPIPRAFKSPPISFTSVYDGQHCLGHVIGRGKLGVEAFDTEDRSRGTFTSLSEAANALISKIEGPR